VLRHGRQDHGIGRGKAGPRLMREFAEIKHEICKNKDLPQSAQPRWGARMRDSRAPVSFRRSRRRRRGKGLRLLFDSCGDSVNYFGSFTANRSTCSICGAVESSSGALAIKAAAIGPAR
jgi:hypothetical protein